MANTLRNGLIGIVLGMAAAIAPGSIDINTQHAYAQSPSASPSQRTIEQFSHRDYKKAIDENDSVLILFYQAARETKNPSETQGFNATAQRFMDRQLETYGQNIQKYGTVVIPGTREGREIVKLEIEKDKLPSVVLYIKGKPEVRIRGVPNQTNYPLYDDSFKKNGINKK